MSESNQSQTIALGLLGAAVGGCVGYFVFFWMAKQGFYALALPGGLLGLAAGLCARERSRPLAAICAVAGLMLGLFTEWRFSPFLADHSFTYFLTHVHTLQTVTLLMLALGVFLSYSLALRRKAAPEKP
ncbi:MAG TPA: hypothetical protein VK961_00800 [Chthoniobacter sp.]|nr:hypothetical protein [Chthoniobacter sp.]